MVKGGYLVVAWLCLDSKSEQSKIRVQCLRELLLLCLDSKSEQSKIPFF